MIGSGIRGRADEWEDDDDDEEEEEEKEKEKEHRTNNELEIERYEWIVKKVVHNLNPRPICLP
jgi:hypothetical protein